MTDAEKFVRSYCPEATVSGPMLNGKPHADGWYGVYLSPFQSYSSGHGKTIIAAWADAANRLEAQMKRRAEFNQSAGSPLEAKGAGE
jgi:hypothetical protein